MYHSRGSTSHHYLYTLHPTSFSALKGGLRTHLHTYIQPFLSEHQQYNVFFFAGLRPCLSGQQPQRPSITRLETFHKVNYRFLRKIIRKYSGDKRQHLWRYLEPTPWRLLPSARALMAGRATVNQGSTAFCLLYHTLLTYTVNAHLSPLHI